MARATPKTWERARAATRWCFTDLHGGVLRNSNWRARVFEPAVTTCLKTGDSFPSITPHDLRHTAASLTVSAGANVKAVQRMLGHAKASMTLDVYADLFDEDLDDVAANLDVAIRNAAVRRSEGQRRPNDELRSENRGGAKGIRTPDLLDANESRYQLRHSP